MDTKILKLTNGDEIITTLSAKSDNTVVTAHNPLKINSYPRISVLIQKDYEITKLGIDEYADKLINAMDNNILTVLDGMKGSITDYNDLGNYMDKKNQTLYIIDEAVVANVGRIKTIAAILFKKDNIISLSLNTYPRDFEKFKSSLQIMANSTRL